MQLLNVLQSKYGKERVIFCECDVTDYIQFEGKLSTICHNDCIHVKNFLTRRIVLFDGIGIRPYRYCCQQRWCYERSVLGTRSRCESCKYISMKPMYNINWTFFIERRDPWYSVSAKIFRNRSRWSRWYGHQHQQQRQYQSLRERTYLFGNKNSDSQFDQSIWGINT